MLRYGDRVRTAAIIPAFNEAESLPAVLAELALTVPDPDVIVGDDGSTAAAALIERLD
ncbi:MAG: glycosyltransferase family 2 protein, partial [Actinobacteria bacterium]